MRRRSLSLLSGCVCWKRLAARSCCTVSVLLCHHHGTGNVVPCHAHIQSQGSCVRLSTARGLSVPKSHHIGLLCSGFWGCGMPACGALPITGETHI